VFSDHQANGNCTQVDGNYQFEIPLNLICLNGSELILNVQAP